MGKKETEWISEERILFKYISDDRTDDHHLNKNSAGGEFQKNKNEQQTKTGTSRKVCRMENINE